MTKVVLHGELGQAVGREIWHLSVKTAAEALRAIEINTGKLFKYLKEKDGGFAYYRIMLDDQDWKTPEELYVPTHAFKTIHFVPVMAGAASGPGIGMIIAGVLLMILAIVLAIPSGGASIEGFMVAFPSLFLAGMWNLGLALIIGGVASLLTPTSKFGTDEKPANRPSYLFSGPVNTYQQGNPVPLLYGFALVGSQVIATGVRATDLPIVTNWSATVRYAEGVQVQYNHRYYQSRHDEDPGVGAGPNIGHVPPDLIISQTVGYNDWWKDVTNES